MPGQLHRDYAMMALRDAYQKNTVSDEGDAQGLVMLAARKVPGPELGTEALISLTNECHKALLLEGAIKKNPVGRGYIPNKVA